jgi:membrane-associated phospholipid phosphatase
VVFVKYVLVTSAIVVLFEVAVADAQTDPAPAPPAPIMMTPVNGFAVVGAVGGIALLGAGLALHFGPGWGPTNAQWRGGILFDEIARDGLRLQSHDAREIAAGISDVFILGLAANAQLDAFAGPLAAGNTDLAWQASFAHFFAMGTTLTLGELVKNLVGRARPFERECAADASSDACLDSDRYRSFYSLHSGVAFTSAGFSCAMHMTQSVYSDPLTDVTSCATSMGLAAVTGLLRVMADRHYLSDVLIGGALGFIAGYLAPFFLLPGRVAPTQSVGSTPAAVGVIPSATTGGLDGTRVVVNVAGVF